VTVKHYGNPCLCGKRQYTKPVAKQAAARWRNNTGESNMVAFKCPHNHKLWHLGHDNYAAGGRSSRAVLRRDLERIIDRQQDQPW